LYFAAQYIYAFHRILKINTDYYCVLCTVGDKVLYIKIIDFIIQMVCPKLKRNNANFYTNPISRLHCFKCDSGNMEITWTGESFKL